MHNDYLIELLLKNPTTSFWNICLLDFCFLLYPVYKLYSFPIFNAPVGIVVSSEADICSALSMLSPLKKKQSISGLSNRHSIDLAFEKENFEIVPFLFLRTPENLEGLKYLSELSYTSDSKIHNRIPIVFFLGGIPSVAKQWLSGKFNMDFPKSIIPPPPDAKMQIEFINFIINYASSFFPSFSVREKLLTDSDFDWIEESSLCLYNFFKSQQYWDGSTDFKTEIMKAASLLKADWNSLNVDDIPELVANILNEFTQDIPGILNRNDVTLDDVKNLGIWPLYDDKSYFLTGNIMKQLVQKMTPIISESELKETLATHGILSRTGQAKPIYGRKIPFRFKDGTFKQPYYFCIPRSFLDLPGELSWVEKITFGGTTYESNECPLPDNRNSSWQFPTY